MRTFFVALIALVVGIYGTNTYNHRQAAGETCLVSVEEQGLVSTNKGYQQLARDLTVIHGSMMDGSFDELSSVLKSFAEKRLRIDEGEENTQTN